jgi:hypothetical protein
VTRPASTFSEPTFIEDIDQPPLEVISPKDRVLRMVVARGRITGEDSLVVTLSDYDDKLAVR